MLYKNTRSGEVRDFSCTISSDVWEPLEKKAPKTTIKEVDEKPARRIKKA